MKCILFITALILSLVHFKEGMRVYVIHNPIVNTLDTTRAMNKTLVNDTAVNQRATMLTWSQSTDEYELAGNNFYYHLEFLNRQSKLNEKDPAMLMDPLKRNNNAARLKEQDGEKFRVGVSIKF